MSDARHLVNVDGILLQTGVDRRGELLASHATVPVTVSGATDDLPPVVEGLLEFAGKLFVHARPQHPQTVGPNAEIILVDVVVARYIERVERRIDVALLKVTDHVF